MPDPTAYGVGRKDPEWICIVGQDITFRLPSVLGLVCHSCGCSERDACEEGCGWASDMRCTGCAGSEEEAADAAPPA